MNIYMFIVNLYCDKDVMNINYNKIRFKVFFLRYQYWVIVVKQYCLILKYFFNLEIKIILFC